MIRNPADPADDRRPDQPHWETFEFAVEGERPIQHAHRIEKLLSGEPGVKKVEAHPREERVFIRYDARLTDPAQLHEHLEVAGYKPSRRAE